MKWLQRLFGNKTGSGESRSRQELASSIAEAGDSLGNATITMLAKLEEMMAGSLSAQEQEAAAKSLDSLESTLESGVVSPSQVKSGRDRIRSLREKLAKMGQSSSSGESETDRVLRKCGGCGSDDAGSLELVKDKNHNHGYLCPRCRSEYESLLLPDSIRRFWMCGDCHFRILAGTRIDAEVDPDSTCPHCGANVTVSLVNLDNDRPTENGLMGEPLA